ncbi:MAG: hypothetical protein ACR2PA_18415 [Hyphomicrobiaceae bacterium]
MDLKDRIIVFAHIQKTGGKSVAGALRRAIGQHRCLYLREQKVENVRSSRAAELGVLALVEWRKLIATTQRSHYLLPRGWNGDLDQIALLHGHFCIGQEPQTGRRPTYLSVAREPIDRFLSCFHFRLDQLNAAQRAKRLSPSHPMIKPLGRPPESPQEFLRLLEASGAKNWRNSQCRYFSPAGTFEAARRVIETRDVITAPMTRLAAFAETVSDRLGIEPLEVGHLNRGKSRAGASSETLSSADTAAIRRHFEEDQRLYDYVYAQKS